MAKDKQGVSLDEIGVWSEVKLKIIKEYAKAYSTILAKQPYLNHVYIDGFAGAGMHVSKATGDRVAGSPLNVASVDPRFREYHLVELDDAKVAHLRFLFAGDQAVAIHHGDCNRVLVDAVLPTVQYRQYRRAFCLLDPYGLDLDWRVVECAGKLRTVDVLINFPIMDMNRNVLWHDTSGVSTEDVERMERFWGDDSWRGEAYKRESTLFGDEDRKLENEVVVNAFCERLKQAGGFEYVAQPLPMRNSTNAVVYYLVFATQNKAAYKIISYLFERERGSMHW